MSGVIPSGTVKEYLTVEPCSLQAENSVVKEFFTTYNHAEIQIIKPYPKYKDSGVEWIGEVPEGWEISLLKRYCKVTDGSHFSPKTVLEGRPYISVKDVDEKGISFNNCKRISEEDFEQLKKNGCSPLPGDVLLTKDGTIGRGVIVNDDFPEFVALSSLGILTPSSQLLSQYLLFYLLSGINMQQMLRTIHGSALTRLTIEKINHLLICIPSYTEQTAIAEYLDRKTAEIDNLIANKERLIELYEEEKKAVINQAVTKGLDPDAEMKDSGVEWLGEVPVHWEVLQLDYLIRVKARLGWKGLKASEYVPEGYGFLSTPNIKGSEIKYETINFISEERYLESPEIMLKDNDVLLAKDGSTLGIVNIVKKLPFACTVNSSIAVLRVVRNEKILPDFLRYFMSCEIMQQVIERTKGGMGVPHLFQGDINKFKLLSPTIKEQVAIVHHIETQCSHIDAIITKLKKQIKLFKEYRTALISEAVTGKIDLRDNG
ncbi:MAG: restriction endonuclease subunit S [Candidatus Electrothrix sp. ATG1]|nr:restriction endonuclease subunit S [Candidatus Electrothrix sp. ATG1]